MAKEEASDVIGERLINRLRSIRESESMSYQKPKHRCMSACERGAFFSEGLAGLKMMFEALAESCNRASIMKRVHTYRGVIFRSFEHHSPCIMPS